MSAIMESNNNIPSVEDFSVDFPTINSTMTCYVIPPRSNSHGVLGSLTDQTSFLTYTMPLLELQMGFILFISHAIHFLLKPFGISAFVSCILTGIFLGPTGIGRYNFMKEVIFPHESQDIINTAALLGFNIYIFLAAVKMEVGMVLKAGYKALSIGILSIIIPLTCSFLYTKSFGQGLETELNVFGGSAVVAMLTVTSLPVVAYVIDQLKITNSELGRLGLASGLVADVLGLSITIFRGLHDSKSFDQTLRNLIPVIVFLLALTFILRPAINWVIRHTPERNPVSNSVVYVIMALAIASEAYFHAIGQYQYLAPFLFGLAIPAGAPLGSALVEKFASFTIGILLHILVPISLMRADLWLVLTRFAYLKKYVAIIVLSFSVKMVSCLIPSLASKVKFVDAMALAFIMNYIGVVQLLIGVMCRDTQMIKDDVFALVAFYTFLNATIVPIIVKWLYRPSRNCTGYEVRNILTLKPRSELKIVSCIYRQDNVDSFLKLLEAIHPTKVNPVSIYVLHLMELLGRYAPVMIAHSKHKPISNSSSQNIIYPFNQYEQNNWDSVSINFFTAMSSFPLMHEDICNLAVDKRTALIILPLHRRWSIHGNIESEDKRLRHLNRSVLDKAPCSSAIYFNRGRLGRQKSAQDSSNLSICVIFFGGNDDREALILAKRMFRQSKAGLTVINFVCKDEDRAMLEEEPEDKMYDHVLLEEVKQIARTDERLEYKEQRVEDGPETVLIVRSMANEFDLFMVGRRHGVNAPQTSGLSQWSELPELGVIGDLFASKDLMTRASVLVVNSKHEKYT